jgi:enamine deaminase RidA (YjgF/YER057c/UK114 family)
MNPDCLAPTPVKPASLPEPRGYSHGTLTGNTLYLGGQTALDNDMKIVRGGIVAQFRQAFSNILETLAAAGGVPADLASITLYLTDIPDYQAHGKEIGAVWRELAGSVYPAMAGIGTTGLWQDEALIEILGVAVIPEDRIVRSDRPADTEDLWFNSPARVHGGSAFERLAGYARAARAGTHVAVSGTAALDENGTALHPGNAYEQAREAISRALDAAARLGAHRQDVVRTRLYLAPDADWRAAVRGHGEAFSGVDPANTTLFVHGFIPEGCLLEFELDAVVS